jgi:GNAT superfamily N-acetyltransferase
MRTAGAEGALQLRPMTQADIPLGLRLSKAAGWNQTAADWELLLRVSRVGSFVASWEGAEAGTVTTVSYGGKLHWIGKEAGQSAQASVHWIGMVLVAEAFQRRGIGAALLQVAIRAVQGQGAVCLDSTPAGKPLYTQLGFQEVYGLARWLRPARLPLPRPEKHCRPLTPADLPGVLAYDHPVFGAERGEVLAALRQNAPGLAWAAECGGRLGGYCLGRRGRRYTQIGPLAAERLEDARDLLLSAALTVSGEELIVDAPDDSPGWTQILGDLGFTVQRPFTRMRLGEWALPEGHWKQRAIAGPEIG